MVVFLLFDTNLFCGYNTCMVNKKDTDEVQDDLEFTADTDTIETSDPELSDIEEAEDNKLKTLKTKLTDSEERNREQLEELQRTKADFLNARKRLEEERLRDRERAMITHIEKLLPLCDSFFLAMQDSASLEASDPKWRRGIEGTYNQLKGIMDSYGITAFNPTGEIFNPALHEALSLVKIENPEQNNRIINIIQQGYELKRGETTELIRPARVTVGTLE